MGVLPTLKRGKAGSKSVNALIGKIPTVAKANLGLASASPGALVYSPTAGASNTPSLVFSDGTNWKLIAIGATMS